MKHAGLALLLFAGGFAMAILIKRYANRKLYDTAAKRYVTLDNLEEMIRAGKEIAVRDVATGEDLTPVILTQIMLLRERGAGAALPNAFLHQLIRYGSDWRDFMAQGLAATLEGVVSSQRDANRILKEWAARAGLAQDDDTAGRPEIRASQRRQRGRPPGQRSPRKRAPGKRAPRAPRPGARRR